MLNSTETNIIEYKRQYTDTIIKDVLGFLNYSLGRTYLSELIMTEVFMMLKI